jgi:hypothetical protein
VRLADQLRLAAKSNDSTTAADFIFDDAEHPERRNVDLQIDDARPPNGSPVQPPHEQEISPRAQPQAASPPSPSPPLALRQPAREHRPPPRFPLLE